MTKEEYIRLTGYFREHPKQAEIAEIANKVLTGFVFITYPLVLLFLYLTANSCLCKAVMIPFWGFILVSLFRRIVNRRRPYEAFHVPSAIKKDTKGKSFPSRHVFSAAVIAAVIFRIDGLQFLGVFLLLAAMALAAIRFMTGVHYLSDVLAGLLLGIGIAWIGFL